MNHMYNEIVEDINTLGREFDINKTCLKLVQKYNISENKIKPVILKLMKETYSYNLNHIDSKYSDNDEFVKFIKPKSILDLFAGTCYYEKYKKDGIEVVQNDVNGKDNDILKSYNFDYTIDAGRLLGKFIYEDRKFDIVDVDPFNSPMQYIENAIKIAKKGLVVTFGDFAILKMPGIDCIKKKAYFYRTYGFKSISKVTIEHAISCVQKIASKNNIELNIIKISKNSNHYRVYFKISKMKAIHYLIDSIEVQNGFIKDYHDVKTCIKIIADSIDKEFNGDYELIKNNVSKNTINSNPKMKNIIFRIKSYYKSKGIKFNFCEILDSVLNLLNPNIKSFEFKKVKTLKKYWSIRDNRIACVKNYINGLGIDTNDSTKLIHNFCLMKNTSASLLRLRSFLKRHIHIPFIFVLFESYYNVLRDEAHNYLTIDEIECIENNGNILGLKSRKYQKHYGLFKSRKEVYIKKLVEHIHREKITTMLELVEKMPIKTISSLLGITATTITSYFKCKKELLKILCNQTGIKYCDYYMNNRLNLLDIIRNDPSKLKNSVFILPKMRNCKEHNIELYNKIIEEFPEAKKVLVNKRSFEEILRYEVSNNPDYFPTQTQIHTFKTLYSRNIERGQKIVDEFEFFKKYIPIPREKDTYVSILENLEKDINYNLNDKELRNFKAWRAKKSPDHQKYLLLINKFSILEEKYGYKSKKV